MTIYQNKEKHIRNGYANVACGNELVIKQSKLLQGRTQSCGCLKREITSKRRSANLTGLRFGKLTVIKRNGSIKDLNGNNKSSLWYCKCDCGGEKLVRASSLIKGDCLSCGCIVSQGENEIKKFLDKMNINYKSQYWFDNLRSNKNRPLYFDFAIFSKTDNLIGMIEFQGIQHYKDFKNFGKMQREVTDEQKRIYCSTNNIPLFEIRYDDNIEKAIKQILQTMNILI